LETKEKEKEMRNQDYNPITKECKLCGCLLPDTDKDREAHTPGECLRMKFYADERLKHTPKIEPVKIAVEPIPNEPGKFLIKFGGPDFMFLTTPISVSLRLTAEQLEKLVTMGEQELFDSSLTKGE